MRALQKFRAWTGNEMRYDIVGFNWDESFGVCNAWLGNNIEYNADNFLINVLLLQYTGLKDKNGVEIYEGDVISELSEQGEDWANHILAEVVWHKVGFYGKEKGHEPEYPITEFVKGEVIGNIWENPELMEVAE